MPRRQELCLLLLFIFAVPFVFSAPSPLIPSQLSRRQTATSINGTVQGGSESAQHAAEAAGNTISTGSGGDRSSPKSQEGFAKLLSGVFFGALLTLLFGGAFIVQAWHYFERFGRRGSDKLSIQVAVGTMIVFSLLQDCAVIHRIWDIHVNNFGDFAFPLLTVGWEICVSWVCIAINTGLAQTYYVHRVWLAFNKNRILLAVYVVLLSFTFCGGFASAAMIIEAGSAANVKGQALHSFQPNSIPWQFSVVFATWLCSSASIDVSLCLSLIWQLKKMSTPFFHTRHAVARLLLLSIETCLGTTTLSLASMILFLAIPYQTYFQIPFLPIGQVMCCSLLVTLMSRPSIARELAQDQTTLTLQGGLEKASLAAPRTLAKPVLKRLMRQERKKRPMGDGTGVHMTTTMQQQACGDRNNDDDDDGDLHPSSSGELTPINDDLEPLSKPNSITDNPPLRNSHNAERPFSVPTMQPREESKAGDESVIENLIGFLQESRMDTSHNNNTKSDIATPKSVVSRKPLAEPPNLPPPPKPRPSPRVRVHTETEAAQHAVHPFVSGMAMGKSESQQSFGRTPRGRMVPLVEQPSPE